MSVAVDVTGSAFNTESGSSPFTYSGLTPSTGLINPAVTFGVLVSPLTTVTATATWAGTACTAIGNLAISGVTQVFLFGLTNPALGSGNNFVLTVTGSLTTPFDVYIIGVSWSGVNQTGGTTSFANFNSNSNSALTASLNLAITTAVGDATICVGSMGSTGTISSSSTPGTNVQFWHDLTGQSNSGTSALGAYNISTSTSTTFTFSNNPSDFVDMIGCDIVGVVGGPQVDIYKRRYTHRRLRPANTNRDPMERRRRVVGWRQAPSGLIVPERKLLIPERLKRAA